MDLSKEDVRKLYGEWWYIVPEDTPAQEVEVAAETKTEAEVVEEQTPPKPLLDSAIFSQGESIVWKLKAEAKIAFVLLENEFTNKNLTASLKSYVLQAGISLSEIGFGIIQQQATQFDLSNVPVNQVVFFGTFSQADLPSSYTWKDKDLFFANTLTHILTGEDYQEHTVELLRQAQFLLHP
ncbi:MAG: hypothetical protein AAGC85_02730 [Bacteroidota bacterium]